MIKELDYPSYYAGGYRRISWGAVFAGAVTSLSSLALMSTLGAALGLGDAARPGQALINSLTAGSVVWLAFSAFASFYAGGWIAGRLTDIARVSESVIHGLASWAAAAAALAFAFTSAAGGAFGLVSRAIGTAPGMIGMDILETATESGNIGIAGAAGFLMLACGLAASAYGARFGTRVLRPVPMPQPQRERLSRPV